MSRIYANVGKPGNLARSLLLYIQKTCFCRKFASRFHHNSRSLKAVRKTGLSANSVNFCKFAEVLQNPHPKPEANPMNNLNNSTKHEGQIGHEDLFLFAVMLSETMAKALFDTLWNCT